MKKLGEYIAEENNQQQTITEELTYDSIIAKLQEAKENDVPIEEGIIGSLVGGLTGLTFGPKVMKAVCKALGVDEKGPFGSLLTSRLILTAVGTSVGWKA